MKHLANNYEQLKASSRFNECLFKHYGKLYAQHRKSRRLFKAAVAWFKMMHYERAMYQAQVNELVHQLNKQNHVAANVTN